MSRGRRRTGPLGGVEPARRKRRIRALARFYVNDTLQIDALFVFTAVGTTQMPPAIPAFSHALLLSFQARPASLRALVATPYRCVRGFREELPTVEGPPTSLQLVRRPHAARLIYHDLPRCFASNHRPTTYDRRLEAPWRPSLRLHVNSSDSRTTIHREASNRVLSGLVSVSTCDAPATAPPPPTALGAARCALRSRAWRQ